MDKTHYQGDTARLECISIGEPNANFQWQANGVDLDEETSRLLYLYNITADSGGEYTCIISSDIGSDKTSTFLFVYPYFVSHPVDMQVSFGSELQLTCDAIGFPSPKYLWQRADGRKISGDVKNRVLNIHSAQIGDAGEYYCYASGRGRSIKSQSSIISGIHFTLAPS
jgi:titin